MWAWVEERREGKNAERGRKVDSMKIEDLQDTALNAPSTKMQSSNRSAI